MENHYKKFYQKLTVAAGSISILILLMIILGESFFTEWVNYQKEFKKLSIAGAKTEQQAAASKNFPIEMKQVILNDFKRVDRCINCHNGIDNIEMADRPVPHRSHSGFYLKYHPVEKFGCTICHEGQGRGITKNDAFGNLHDSHWESPVLPLGIVESSCGKCHLSAFDEAITLEGMETLNRGRDLFISKGCLGCHKVRGTGGSVGPDLSSNGIKTKSNYPFQNIRGEHTVINWLKQHFLDPQAVVPGSTMPKYLLKESELNGLITYIMGLYPMDYPIKYVSVHALEEYKGKRKKFLGKEAYMAYCSPCHGENGEGKDYRVFKETIPALNNQDFFSMASEDMIRFSIAHGRGGRPMSSWGKGGGNLSGEEINSLTEYIMRWKAKAPSFQEVMASGGNAAVGNTLFRSRCSTCHGVQGDGAIGPKLRSQNFLSIASNEYLYTVIVRGRRNTAMPSWTQLNRNEIADIMTYVRSWQSIPSVYGTGRRIAGIVEEGKESFDTMCSQCHGTQGQGGVGPAILNIDFLKSASDDFLYQSITNGREGSAMQSWIKRSQGMAQLKEPAINSIVAYLRSRENIRPRFIYSNIVAGSPTVGKVMFEGMCASCHGMKGEGIHGPSLNNQEFLNAATNGFLQGTIAQGRSGTAMRSWAKGSQGYEELNEVQINDVISYIRTWQTRLIEK